MTDPISRSPYFKEQRQCAWCHAGISETRPVFLVGIPNGKIVGPFHAGCAERIKLEAAKRSPTEFNLEGASYGTWPPAREETLPE